MSNVWAQVAGWPAGPDGETDFAGAANYCINQVRTLTPEMSAAADRLRERFDELQEIVLRMLEEGIPPDNLLVQAAVFALGIVNIQSAQLGFAAAVQEMNRKPSGSWLPPDNGVG